MDERLERNSSDSLGTLGRSWGWVLFFGLLTLAIGIIMVLYPDVTLKVVGILFALQLFLVGLFTLVTAFTGSERSRVLSAILGALAIIAAIICLKNIAQTVIILTLILGIYWVVYGVIDVVMGIGDRSLPHRGLTIFVGVVSIIAGVIVLSYPVNSARTLALLLGIWFIVLGCLSAAGAFFVRGEDKRLVSA